MGEHPKRRGLSRGKTRPARGCVVLLCAAFLCGGLCACAVAANAPALPPREASAAADTPFAALTPTPEPLIPITQPQLLIYIRRTLHENSRRAFTGSALSLILLVELEGEAVADLSEVALPPALETLVLRGALATDLSPLAGIKTLSDLTLENNPLLRAEARIELGRLTQLTRLTLVHAPVEDCAVFLPLHALETLNLIDSASPEDVAALRKRMPNVTILEKAA